MQSGSGVEAIIAWNAWLMGSESWEVGNGRWQADDIWHIERVSFAAVEGSDHHVHIGAPDQWLEQITAFAASLGP